MESQQTFEMVLNRSRLDVQVQAEKVREKKWDC